MFVGFGEIWRSSVCNKFRANVSGSSSSTQRNGYFDRRRSHPHRDDRVKIDRAPSQLHHRTYSPLSLCRRLMDGFRCFDRSSSEIGPVKHFSRHYHLGATRPPVGSGHGLPGSLQARLPRRTPRSPAGLVLGKRYDHDLQ